MDDSQRQSAPGPCTRGCGFFGNPATEGMCSKCYRDAQAAQHKAQADQDQAQAVLSAAPAAAPEASANVGNAAPQAAEAAASSAAQPAVELPAEVLPPQGEAAHDSTSGAAAPEAVAPAEAAGAASPAAEPQAASKPSTRCHSCRKKVGLLGFNCKCGHLFCGQHRYAEDHACSYDFKTNQRAKLAADNPLVQASKVQRI